MSFSTRRMSLGPLGCLVSLAVLVGLGWLFFQFYKLLWWAVPVFILLAFLIDWRVPAAWGRGLVQAISRKPVSGLIGLFFAAILLPFTSLAMFVHALNRRKIEQMQADFMEQNPFFQQFRTPPPQAKNQPDDDEYADFEEIESTPKKPSDQPKID